MHMKKIAFVVAALIPLAAFAKKEEKAPALRAGVNIPCLEKIVKSDAPTAQAWITLGYLDQVRGDLKSAEDKYRKAFTAVEKDIDNSPIDFTLEKEAVWI